MVVYVDVPVALAAGFLVVLSCIISAVALWGWSYHAKGGR